MIMLVFFINETLARRSAWVKLNFFGDAGLGIESHRSCSSFSKDMCSMISGHVGFQENGFWM